MQELHLAEVMALQFERNHSDHRIAGLRTIYLFMDVGPELLFNGPVITGFIPAHVHLCASSAAEGRQFPSKPLRESQSRLLTSTPSWSESDNPTDKDKKGKIMLHSL